MSTGEHKDKELTYTCEICNKRLTLRQICRNCDQLRTQFIACSLKKACSLRRMVEFPAGTIFLFHVPIHTHFVD